MWTRLMEFLSRVSLPGSRRRLDDELRRELDEHLDLLTDRYILSGMAPAEARMAARRQFGNVTRVREELREMTGWSWVNGVSQDLRHGWRQIVRSRGFSSVVVATLALGIGGTTAVFSVAQAVLLAPLPYEQPDRLVKQLAVSPGKRIMIIRQTLGWSCRVGLTSTDIDAGCCELHPALYSLCNTEERRAAD
jgi:hypothetical protein